MFRAPTQAWCSKLLGVISHEAFTAFCCSMYGLYKVWRLGCCRGTGPHPARAPKPKVPDPRGGKAIGFFGFAQGRKPLGTGPWPVSGTQFDVPFFGT